MKFINKNLLEFKQIPRIRKVFFLKSSCLFSNKRNFKINSQHFNKEGFSQKENKMKFDKKDSSLFSKEMMPSLTSSAFGSEAKVLNASHESQSFNSNPSFKPLVNLSKNAGQTHEKSRFYTSYSKLSEVKLLTIGIASPLRILQWAEKTLPNGQIYGEVLNANTLHHKTFKPQKGGLFCERIFGPLKDFECACGKIDKSGIKSFNESQLLPLVEKQASQQANLLGGDSLSVEKGSESVIDKPSFVVSTKLEKTLFRDEKKPRAETNRKFCPDCDVEYTWSVIRRYQLGYIKLSSPVTHIWFLKGTPSYLSILLDFKKRYLQYVTYCSETLTIENSLLQTHQGFQLDSPSKIFQTWENLVEKNEISKGQLRQSTDNNLLKSFNPSISSTGSAFDEKEQLWKKEEDEDRGEQKGVMKKRLAREKRHYNRLLYAPCVPESIERYSDKSLSNYPSNFQLDASKKTKTLKKDESGFNYKETILNLPFVLSLFFKNQKFSSSSFFKEEDLHKKSTLLMCSLQMSMYYKSFRNLSPNQILLFKRTFFQSSESTHSPFNQKGGLKKQTLFKSGAYSIEGGKQQMEGNDSNYFIKEEEKFSVFKQITKKLPIDIYILSSLERMLHKSEIIFSINQTWKSLYKRSFLVAFKKAAFIMSQSILLDFKKDSFMKTMRKALSNEGRRSLFSFRFLKKEINLKLRTIKKDYGNHVLLTLKVLKTPILSLKYTTNLFNSNEQKAVFGYTGKIKTGQGTKEEGNSRVEEDFRVLLTDVFIKPLIIKQSFKLFQFLSWQAQEQSLISLIKTELNLKKDLKEKTPLSTLLTYYKLFFFSLISLLSSKKSSRPFFLLPSNLPSGLAAMESSGSFSLKPTLLQQSWKRGKTGGPQIFNNVYTLSHRQRWENDKDWQIFSIFNTSVSEFTDFPINTYKKRLYSVYENFEFLNLSDKSMPFYTDEMKKDYTYKLSTAFYSGAGIVQQLLNEFTFSEIQKIDKQNRLILYELNKSIFRLKKEIDIFVFDKSLLVSLKELCKKRDLLIRRTKLVRKLFRKESNPGSMILTILPVLPPDLRPIVKMGSQIAASDLNRLYQRVIYRNDRLKKFLKDPATSHSYEMKYAQRLLQEAVDNLMQNGKSGLNSEKDARGRVLKSLSDILKGKQGRFRQFLLGKRVDYSGRSVIVVGPKLKLHECGLPLEMAKELYLPFLLKKILNQNYAKTVIGAKSLIKKNPSLTEELLREIMRVSPILLNRAPTLHRLGIQAFVPKLIEGRAILLHPLVCSAFNADFDGDQMAVHVPITVESRAEAWKLMLSRNNILSPATGDPLAIPSQDMILGCYYLTTYSSKVNQKKLNGSKMYFNNLNDALNAYYQKYIDIHALIWVKWLGPIENGSDQQEPLEIRISSFGQSQEITSHYHRIYEKNNQLVSQYFQTTPGRILLNLIIQKRMLSF